MTSVPQDFNFFLIFGHFVLLIPFKILLHYANNDGSHCFDEDVQWIMDKVFREKTYGLNDFNTVFSHFPTEFLGL